MCRKELSHSALPTPHSALDWQADVYLEGSDQHRGWFQSSLLLSLAGNGAAPYKTVLTHGFMVDADREKISKSKQGAGGYEKPQTSEAYVKKYGADVVRLWVASQDYRSDIVVSEERINKVAETYRGIRNCLRYQLSNLYDFHPSHDAVADAALTGLDRWILGKFSELEKDVMAAYDAYEFHVVYQKISQFVAVELSAIYHDVVKDRLYTLAAKHPKRRSTQTALHRMVTGLCQMLSPILAFTADEAWEFIPGADVVSVHESEWKVHGIAMATLDKLVWQKFFTFRELVFPHLEKARQAKEIGKSLDAKIAMSMPEKAFNPPPGYSEGVQVGGMILGFQADQNFWTESNKEILRELLNVSQFSWKPLTDTTEFIFEALKADGQKCDRCWHWEMDVGLDLGYPLICGRCVEAEKANQPA